MDLQLYRMDQTSYLVDFRNVGYYRSSTEPNDYTQYRRTSNATSITDSLTSHRDLVEEKTEPVPSTSPMKRPQEHEGNMHAGLGGLGDEGRIKEVCSPFLFLEVACRLIVELASG